MTDRLTTTEVARTLKVNEASVRRMHDMGVLIDVLMTPMGRLFNPTEVEALRQARLATTATR